MALKPNDQMILILDGDPRDLHFDIRNNRVLGYDINKIAEAMLQAALAFEKSRRLYFEELSLKLSPDAHLCLNQALQDQGILHRARIDFLSAAGEELQEDTKAIVNTMRYIDAVRELLAKRLVTTDWKVAITARRIRIRCNSPTLERVS